MARVTLDVPPGGALMVTGANGSGKTTLLRCIATALKPHHGQIRLGEVDIWADRREARKRIALLSHASRLYEDLSAAENLRSWARMGGLAVDVPAALARVGLPADRRDPVRTFSAGMKRRLALARALLKNPDVLLLDEPFAALDPDGRELVGRLVDEIRASGVTLVVATHLPGSALSFCDQAAHMDDGRVIWRGEPSATPALGGHA